MSERLVFDFALGGDAAKGARRPPAGPLRVLLIGNFRGESTRPPLRERQPLRVEADSLDARLASLEPSVSLAALHGAGETAPLVFRSLDDLHPDGLCRQVPLLQSLIRERIRLGDGGTAAVACESIARLLAVSGASAPELAACPQSVDAAALHESDAATLARLLGGAPSPPPTRDAAARLVRAAVAPHVVAPESAQVRAHRAALDELATVALRRVLRDPGFRALEIAWRGLAWLVTSSGAGDEVEWWMLDATWAELADDLLGSGTDLSGAALHDLLVTRGRGQLGGTPWSLLLGSFEFGPGAADALLLARLGALAAAAGAPFIAGAQPALLGCADPDQLADPKRWAAGAVPEAEAWDALRRSAGARWLALALPRLLLRLPYGTRSDPIETFPFEEVPDPREHDAFVWGNAALAPALLLANAFASDGWQLDPYAVRDLDGLPACTYPSDEGAQLLPCAEVLLPEPAVAGLLQRGFVPLVSHRASPRVRVPGLPSLARPPAPLAGPWERR